MHRADETIIMIARLGRAEKSDGMRIADWWE